MNDPSKVPRGLAGADGRPTESFYGADAPNCPGDETDPVGFSSSAVHGAVVGPRRVAEAVLKDPANVQSAETDFVGFSSSAIDDTLDGPSRAAEVAVNDPAKVQGAETDPLEITPSVVDGAAPWGGTFPRKAGLRASGLSVNSLNSRIHQGVEGPNSRIQSVHNPSHARASVASAPAFGACCARALGVAASADGGGAVSCGESSLLPAGGAADACCDAGCMHVAPRQSGSQVPRRWSCSKAKVSSPSEDKVSDPEGTETYLRTAGGVRGPVVGSSPGRREGTRKALGAVTPSVHLGVPVSLSVTPGRGEGIRQQLGWKKVCGTEDSGIWVLKGESRGYALPSNLDHLGVAWMEKRTYSTAWVTPRYRCSCAYKYGGAAVGPQSDGSIWNGVMGLWSRVAPLLTPWCTAREVPSGVNLNRYAGWGSSIPWHSDNEPLFGDQSDPKVIVSMSLGSSVDFRVCRRGRRNAPSAIRLDHGDLSGHGWSSPIGV